MNHNRGRGNPNGNLNNQNRNQNQNQNQNANQNQNNPHGGRGGGHGGRGGGGGRGGNPNPHNGQRGGGRGGGRGGRNPQLNGENQGNNRPQRILPCRTCNANHWEYECGFRVTDQPEPCRFCYQTRHWEHECPTLHNNNGDDNNNNNRNNNNNNNHGGQQNPPRIQLRERPDDPRCEECRICRRRNHHWESQCRLRAAGTVPLNCRICIGGFDNHWENECPARHVMHGGANGNADQNANENIQAILLAPDGADISRFFPGGNFPMVPCHTCHRRGHWHNVCTFLGFDAVFNPNPEFSPEGDGMANNPADNLGWGVARPHTPARPNANANLNRTPYPAPGQPYPAPPSNYPPNSPAPPLAPRHNFGPPNFQAPPRPANPYDPSHPDSPFYRSKYRSNRCPTCGIIGHRDGDCMTFGFLLPNNHPSHPSVSGTKGFVGMGVNNGRGFMNYRNNQHPNSIVYPHPENRFQGRAWHEDASDFEERYGYAEFGSGGVAQGAGVNENQNENGNRVVVRGMGSGGDDTEGSGLRWVNAPGGLGGEEMGGMVRRDGEGDLVMLDVGDWEVRKLRREEGRKKREQGGWGW